MADINTEIDKISTAVYGEEIRGSIVNALSYIDKSLNNKQEKRGLDTEPTLNSPNYLTSGAVYTALQKKADKATTLSGYGITDAYTKTEADNSLANKADKSTTLAGYGITDAYTKENAKDYFGFGVSVGFDINGVPIKVIESTAIGAGLFANSSVTAIFISSKVTTLQSGALAGCSALTDVYINNTEGGLTIQSGAIPPTAAIHYVNDYEFGKSYIKALATIPIIQTKLAALPTYEEGSGTLTPTAENKLKNASFNYQRLGNCVTVQIACTFLAYEQTADGTVRLNGLPFVCGNDLPPRLLNITSQKREVISAISYSTSALVLIFRQAESFTEDETLSFEITYKIK